MRLCDASGTTHAVGERYVVDTGVFLRWYVPQVGYEHAREVRTRFAAGDATLITTDAARYELPHVLRTKGLQKGHLDTAAYIRASALLDDLELARSADAPALRRAAAVATTHMVRFFDALFVDLAIQEGVALLTSDGKLARAVSGLTPAVLLRGISP